jgi:hypothetical protein
MASVSRDAARFETEYRIGGALALDDDMGVEGLAAIFSSLAPCVYKILDEKNKLAVDAILGLMVVLGCVLPPVSTMLIDDAHHSRAAEAGGLSIRPGLAWSRTA